MSTLLNLLVAVLVSLAGSVVWLIVSFSYTRLASERYVLSLRQRHDIDLPIPRGGPRKKGPASSNPRNGGVFPVASLNGEMTQFGFSPTGIAVVLP